MEFGTELNHEHHYISCLKYCLKSRRLPIWRRCEYLALRAERFNLLATEFFFQILAHPVFKMRVIQKPNKVAL